MRRAETVWPPATIRGVLVVTVVLCVLAGASCGEQQSAVVEMEIDPQAATVTSGSQREFSVTAINAGGEVVNISPKWEIVGGIGQVDESGVFTGLKAGNGELVASVGGLEARASVTVTAGEPDRLTVQVKVEELTVGETTAIAARLADGQGNPVPDAIVQFSTETEGASLGTQEATTGPDGSVTSTWTVSTQSGENRLVVTAAHLSEAVLLSGLPGTPTKLDASADPPRVLHGDPTTIGVTVTDDYGNPVSGVEVGFEAKTSGASVSVASAKTDARGLVTAALTTAPEVRDNLLEVAAPELPATTVRVHGGRLSSIRVAPGGAELASGSGQQFDAFGFDEAGNEIGIDTHWSVTGGLGDIDEAGRLTATKAGKGTVAATLRDITGTAEVTVTPGPLERISVSPSEATVTSGSTAEFSCMGWDAAGNKVAVDPEWNAPGDLGAITDHGVFTAATVGGGTIVASEGGVTGKAVVAVAPGSLSTVQIQPEEIVLKAGTEQRFTVTGYDRAGNEVAIEPAWTVSQQIGEVDEAGLFLAVTAGVGELVAVSRSIAARARIRVTPGELSEIVVTPMEVDVPSGTSLRFAAVGKDDHGNEVPLTPSWSVTGGIGRIDTTGLFTGVTAGDGQVVATSGIVAGRTKVNVTPGELASIRLLPEQATVAAGSTQQFRAQGFDAAGNQKTVRPDWTVIGGVGEIDPAGILEAKVAGTGQVVVGHGGVSAEATVIVEAGKLTAIVVAPGSVNIASGSKQRFAAVGEDAYGNEIPVEPSWSVTGEIGVIEGASGAFTALAAVEGSVVATVGAIGGQARVIVKPGPLATIAVDSPATVQSGETWQFHATGLDRNDNEIPISVSWRITGGVGTVDRSGLFAASHAGKGEVVAQVGEIERTAEVEVLPGKLVAVKVIPNQATVASGRARQFSAVGADSLENEIQLEPEWTVEGGVGSINLQGLFQATVAGTGKVVATAGSITSGATVTIIPAEIATISVVPAAIEIAAGETQQFLAKGLDGHGNEREIQIEWSATSGLGGIDSSGLFAAKNSGQGKVLAVYRGLMGSANVTTVAGRLSKLRVLPSGVELQSGSTQQFRVEGMDAYGNALVDPDVRWAVLGGIGTIDEKTGLLTGVTVGAGRVVAASGPNEAAVEAHVIPGGPSASNSSIFISPTSLAADGEATAQIVITVRDSFNNPIPGVGVTVTSDRAKDAVELSEQRTDANGMVEGRIASHASGKSVLSVVVDGLSLFRSEPIEFE